MTKAERTHYDRLSRLGCIVCRNMGYTETPCEIHHTKELTGAGRKSHYSQAIPLCPTHHRLGNYGIAYHAGPEEWERVHGSQQRLLAQVNELLGVPA